jgi:hypothetical protein
MHVSWGFPDRTLEEEQAMTIRMMATVVDGILRPDESLSLPDQTRVSLWIEPVEGRLEAREAWASLRQWIRTHPLHGLGPRLTRDELHERH